MIPLGIHRDIPASVYHAEEGASASRLRTIHNSTPAHLKLEMENPTAPTWEMQLGNVIHPRILEPGKPIPALALQPADYVVPADYKGGPKDPKPGDVEPWNWRRKFCKQWGETMEAAGKIVVERKDLDEIDRCAERVMAHPEARELLEGADTEVTLRWETECKTPLKARLDMVPRGQFLGDLKTTNDASQRGFERKCLSMGYHLQAAFYLDLWNWIGGTRQFTGFRLIAYERETGLVSVNQMSAELIQEGRLAYETALEKFIAATRTGVWPAYPGLQMLDVPKWKRRDE